LTGIAQAFIAPIQKIASVERTVFGQEGAQHKSFLLRVGIVAAGECTPDIEEFCICYIMLCRPSSWPPFQNMSERKSEGGGKKAAPRPSLAGEIGVDLLLCLRFSGSRGTTSAHIPGHIGDRSHSESSHTGIPAG
jgi:hypothetical protein